MTVAIKHAAVCVTDLNRAKQFFCENFGFREYHTSDNDWMMLESEGTTLSLVRVTKKAPISMAAAKGGHPAHLGLVVKTREAVDVFQARMKGIMGVTTGSIEEHRDGSRGFYFQDIDGNQFECIFIPYEGLRPDKDSALVLIAHGSRDANWREPLERLRANVARHSQRRIDLCYMEMCSPGLKDVIAAGYEKGVRSFEVVPVFLATGAHVTNDIPKLVKEAEAQYGDCTFTIRKALGEEPGVMEALTAAALTAASPAPLL